MPFSESTKLEAKRRSHFQCVVCHQPFVEVHHLVPQSEGGSDDLENACPLCASCHDLLGANKEKRKQLGEMRDLQWELNEKRRQNPDTFALHQKLDSIQAQVASGQFAFLDLVKGLMIEHNNRSNVAIAQINTPEDFASTTGVYLPPQKPKKG